MRYCPVPSLTTVRVFSMSAGLDASTVTPGSTAADGSRTTPAIVAWANTRLGSSRIPAPAAMKITTRCISHLHDLAHLGARGHLTCPECRRSTPRRSVGQTITPPGIHLRLYRRHDDYEGLYRHSPAPGDGDPHPCAAVPSRLRGPGTAACRRRAGDRRGQPEMRHLR